MYSFQVSGLQLDRERATCEGCAETGRATCEGCAETGDGSASACDGAAKTSSRSALAPLSQSLRRRAGVATCDGTCPASTSKRSITLWPVMESKVFLGARGGSPGHSACANVNRYSDCPCPVLTTNAVARLQWSNAQVKATISMQASRNKYDY